MSKSDHLKEYIIRDVIEFFAMDNNLDAKEAISTFYNSEVFNKLDDSETELYLCSSAYVYDLFCNEIQNGKIVQNEV